MFVAACAVFYSLRSCQVLQSLLYERIHPPDVIGKYAPDSVIGNVGSGVAAPVAGGAAKAGGAPARTGLC